MKAAELGPGLIVRPIRLADSAELFAMVDKNRQSFREWLPWLDRTQSVADSEVFIRMCLEVSDKGEAWTFVLEKSGRLAGLCSYHPIDKKNRSVNLGYWVGAEFQGQGLAKAGTRFLIDQAFGELNLNRVEIRCAVGNVGSQKVAEALGLKFEGVARDSEWLYDHFVDHRVYSVLKREW